jgi:hypothetical protein
MKMSHDAYKAFTNEDLTVEEIDYLCRDKIASYEAMKRIGQELQIECKRQR